MIRQIDRLILRELMAPWLFGVGLFAALLMAATYLGRIAGFIVDGAPPALVIQLVGLLLPSILVKTFSMAVLLAALLGFGRLSSDSEIVALRAGGAGIVRIVAPVIAFSVAIAVATFAFNERIVPYASSRSKQLGQQLVESQKIKASEPIARVWIEHQKLKAAVAARNVNLANKQLEGVTLVAYDDQEHESYVMFAKILAYQGDLNSLATGFQWKIEGGARIVSTDLKQVIDIPGSIWPEQIPRIGQTFNELTAERDDDFDSQSMSELRDSIARHRAKGDKKPADLANYEYGYWTKLSVPLAAIVFGTLGAVLGIRNHRTGTASGFALAVAIIFGYVTLINFMNVWAMGGAIPPYVASFAPLAIGAVVSGVIMWRRNA